MQYIVMQEYIEAVKEAAKRVLSLEGQIRLAVRGWSLEPVLQSLMAMRGVSMVTALTILAELGDLTRFESPKLLMSFLGLVPSEHSSGGTKRQGSITKTGNGHVRRVLIEAAWNYRFPARKSRAIEVRAQKTSERVQAMAWEGQKRLCGRYQKLLNLGKPKQKVCAAVAREMAGFIWAIACEASGKVHASRAAA
jgi:transposase